MFLFCKVYPCHANLQCIGADVSPTASFPNRSWSVQCSPSPFSTCYIYVYGIPYVSSIIIIFCFSCSDSKMAANFLTPFIFFLLTISSAAACDRCLHDSKAAFFYTDSPLSCTTAAIFNLFQLNQFLLIFSSSVIADISS